MVLKRKDPRRHQNGDDGFSIPYGSNGVEASTATLPTLVRASFSIPYGSNGVEATELRREIQRMPCFSIPYGSNGVEAGHHLSPIGKPVRLFQYPLRIEWC